jgi:hypothetical protein
MLPYLTFFIRNGTTLIPFASYRSCSAIGSSFWGVPDGKVREITTVDLERAEKYFNSRIKNCEERIRFYEGEYDFLRSCAQPLTNILEQYDEVALSLNKAKYDMDKLKYGSNFIQFLCYMRVDFRRADSKLTQGQQPKLYMGIMSEKALTSEDILD